MYAIRSYYVIGSSWFVALVAQSPKLYHFFMGQQIIDRMFHAQVLRRNEPFWYYLAYFPLLLFPVITSYSIHYTKLYEASSTSSRAAVPRSPTSCSPISILPVCTSPDPRRCVITSYSIHYTKLYESLPRAHLHVRFSRAPLPAKPG